MASFLSTLFGGGAEKEAADRNRALLGQYQTGGYGNLDKGLASSTGALNTGYDAATGSYNAAKGQYDVARGDYAPLAGLAGNYRAGSDLYLNALGVNGADAARTAASSFTTSPGYQQGIDAGLNAINRRRASGYMLDSGNADLDALNFAQNNQNQQWQSWLDRLGGVNNNALSATGAVAQGQAGIDVGRAGLDVGQAGLDVGRGTGLAGLYSSDADARTNILSGATSGGMSANNMEAAGQASGAKNLLGAGLSLATLAAGGGFGFGGGANSLGSFLSPAGSNPFLQNGQRNTMAYGFG